MPRDMSGHEISPEWTVVRIEKHGRKELDIQYAYLCPGCQITLTRRQTDLFGERTSPL